MEMLTCLARFSEIGLFQGESDPRLYSTRVQILVSALHRGSTHSSTKLITVAGILQRHHMLVRPQRRTQGPARTDYNHLRPGTRARRKQMPAHHELSRRKWLVYGGLLASLIF